MSHVGQTPGDHAADIREISRLLCEWSQLNSLTLSGYSSYPRLLLPNTFPAHAFPTYRLGSLHLLSCNLADSAILWLLGNSAKTLRQLNLCGCSGLTSEVLALVFEVLGSTLETLVLTLDVDDLAAASGPQSIRSEVVATLVELRVVSVSTDAVFPEDIVHTLAALPLVESISLCYPSFTYAIVRDALASLPPGSKLEKLYLDAWETPDMWTETERWNLAQLCEKRGVELVINGLVRADIEEGELSTSLPLSLASNAERASTRSQSGMAKTSAETGAFSSGLSERKVELSTYCSDPGQSCLCPTFTTADLLTEHSSPQHSMCKSAFRSLLTETASSTCRRRRYDGAPCDVTERRDNVVHRAERCMCHGCERNGLDKAVRGRTGGTRVSRERKREQSSSRSSWAKSRTTRLDRCGPPRTSLGNS